MPKIFAAIYTVYFEAFDLKTAQKFAPLLCNRMTHALRANSWTTDNSSVVVYNEGVEIDEVTKQQHQLALDWYKKKMWIFAIECIVLLPKWEEHKEVWKGLV